MTLDSWVARKAAEEGDLLLQMDIEGAEYEVLLAAERATLNRFRIIVLELHGLTDLWQPRGMQFIRCALERLTRDFEIVHLHPNNCAPARGFGQLLVPPVLEVTFLRKDRVASRGRIGRLPHPLDRPNVAGRPDYPLPACWHA